LVQLLLQTGDPRIGGLLGGLDAVHARFKSAGALVKLCLHVLAHTAGDVLGLFATGSQGVAMRGDSEGPSSDSVSSLYAPDRPRQ